MTEPSNPLVARAARQAEAPPATRNGTDIRVDIGNKETLRRLYPSRASDDWYWIDDDDPFVVPWGYFEDDDL